MVLEVWAWAQVGLGTILAWAWARARVGLGTILAWVWAWARARVGLGMILGWAWVRRAGLASTPASASAGRG